jgi:excisionase family DNA binding protein
MSKDAVETSRRFVHAAGVGTIQALDRSPQASSTAAAGRARLTRDEVMTASEVADLLHLPVSTVYYLARRGELPARRLGRTWRFLRPALEELLGA